ncbi:MAG: DNA cytosine methyltransferase [Planctomycetota bacterium]
MARESAIPVIDLFAGPGGLGEGFASTLSRSGTPVYRIALSIEKDPHAYRTLLLRSFFRQFADAAPQDYYDYLMHRIDSVDALFDRHPTAAEAARSEAWQGTLGKAAPQTINRRIDEALARSRPTPWILVGGPPCQAYSVAGRSRMNGSASFADDERHTLYREYLRIIRRHQPSVFVMENVKGLLSSKHRDRLILDQILRDLSRPTRSLKYQLVALDYDDTGLFEAPEFEPENFLVHAERFGVPQNRHRIIIVGVNSSFRSTMQTSSLRLTRHDALTTCRDVINGLPKVRSSLSRGLELEGAWQRHMRSAVRAQWVRDVEQLHSVDLAKRIRQNARETDGTLGIGGRFIEADPSLPRHSEWFNDPRLPGVCNHETRGHIPADLHRYLFVSTYGECKQVSPRLRHFPDALLPAHSNVAEARGNGMFNDRFRVQLWDQPATTVTAHIAKDGHYFIHPDPTQARSLTVREAARLQSFPDNYFFEGPRTEQYRQIGNAVPPLLARQIAAVVASFIDPSLSTH